MKNKTTTYLILALILAFFLGQCTNPNTKITSLTKEIPYLDKRGDVTHLIVEGKPYLLLGGELHNSSSSSRKYMKKLWPKLDSMGLNTVLVAVDWSSIEPEEGKYDFTLIDELLEDARNYNLHVVLLWFGAWKNGQTHYAPEWVKRNYKRFPRVKTNSGKSLEILSALGEETLKTDARAFASMMNHVKKVDSLDRTVIMVQVQNEVGIIGATRDFNDLANKAFSNPVPAELTGYLLKNKDKLLPGLDEILNLRRYQLSGSWEQVFGKGQKTDEIFMAWNYAKYIDFCIKAGKAEYDIPMFVNAWIVQPQDKKPGDYPSGGPQAHLLDIWRAGAPHTDLFCPDIYLPNFDEICKIYTLNNNTLFIPESRADEQGVGQLLCAIGKYKAIGYSPFGIDATPSKDPIADAYKVLKGMVPVILDAQSKNMITASILKMEQNASEEIILGDYKLHVELLKGWGTNVLPEQGYGLFIYNGNEEYIITGSNIQVSFSPATPGPAVAAIANLEEGIYTDGKWIPGRRLNGDDIMLDYDLAKNASLDKTGTGLKFSGNGLAIQKVKLYRYE